MAKVNLSGYLEIEKYLADFFSRINFCVDNCVNNEFSLYKGGRYQIKGEVGCCVEDKSAARTEILRKKSLKELVIQREKLYDLVSENTGNCRYHSSKGGCILKTHKTPVCLGYICEPFEIYLLNQFKIEYNSYQMIQNLEMLLNGDLDQEVLKLQIRGFLKLMK